MRKKNCSEKQLEQRERWGGGGGVRNQKPTTQWKMIINRDKVSASVSVSYRNQWPSTRDARAFPTPITPPPPSATPEISLSNALISLATMSSCPKCSSYLKVGLCVNSLRCLLFFPLSRVINKLLARSRSRVSPTR